MKKIKILILTLSFAAGVMIGVKIPLSLHSFHINKPEPEVQKFKPILPRPLESLPTDDLGFKPYDILNLEHPDWTDTFILKDEKRGCRREVHDCANILLKDETRLILQWDNWGEETFLKNKSNIYQLQELNDTTNK